MGKVLAAQRDTSPGPGWFVLRAAAPSWAPWVSRAGSRHWGCGPPPPPRPRPARLLGRAVRGLRRGRLRVCPLRTERGLRGGGVARRWHGMFTWESHMRLPTTLPEGCPGGRILTCQCPRSTGCSILSQSQKNGIKRNYFVK